MNKERLLKLADYLDSLPGERFYYGAWARGVGDGDTAECGTNACALGHATSIPEFYALGLRLVKDRYGLASVCMEKDVSEVFQGDGPIKSTEAAMEVFDLTEEEAEYLFIPSSYYLDSRGPSHNASAKTVADHIRRFVNGEQRGVRVFRFDGGFKVDFPGVFPGPMVFSRDQIEELYNAIDYEI